MSDDPEVILIQTQSEMVKIVFLKNDLSSTELSPTPGENETRRQSDEDTIPLGEGTSITAAEVNVEPMVPDETDEKSGIVDSENQAAPQTAPSNEIQENPGEGTSTPAADAVPRVPDETNENTGVVDSENQAAPVTAPSNEIQDEPTATATIAYTADSDLSRLDRKIWIVTTAAMPWRTGTAVNPLLRALTLTKHRPKHSVTLLIPWLESAKARHKLYGKEIFQNQQEQEDWIRKYCRERCNATEEEPNLRIRFWQGTYNEGFGSIFPTEDLIMLIPKEEADVAILEEPEHLNWFRLPDINARGNDLLGWAHKFRHVVGVLHTNYAAYIRQYGMGTSLITAPALNGLSALVVRAYCHRVIRLSATLPSLDDRKEVTMNIHGVRDEFLEPPKDPVLNNGDSSKCAAVYFIGKLIWAKGFDQVLELQENYKSATGEYFPIDIYGSGDDERSIRRAFFGRQKVSSSEDDTRSETSSQGKDKQAAQVFGKSDSLRAILVDETPPNTAITTESVDNVSSVCTSPRDSDEETSQIGDSKHGEDEAQMNSPGEMTPVEPVGSPGELAPATDEGGVNPLDILGELSERTMSTTVETADAARQIFESVVQSLFGSKSDDKKRKRTPNPLNLVPSRARFKWRRNPIPARFLGVQDHIIVRDIKEHTIFLNCSTTEVLCTTTSEALAMGKFVIIPKHPSNDFFLAFPNCLAYDDLDDCLEKLQYALQTKPTPLTPEFVHMLSWEGATKRLYEASQISEEEAQRRKDRKEDEADTRAARFHVESARSSHFVRYMIGKKALPAATDTEAPKKPEEDESQAKKMD